MADIDNAIQTALNALDIDKCIVRPECRHGYIIIDVPAIGPNGGHYAVYSEISQAPGGLMAPGKLPPGEIVAIVSSDGNVTICGAAQ